jgi:hypothetical protein
MNVLELNGSDNRRFFQKSASCLNNFLRELDPFGTNRVILEVRIKLKHWEAAMLECRAFPLISCDLQHFVEIVK